VVVAVVIVVVVTMVVVVVVVIVPAAGTVHVVTWTVTQHEDKLMLNWFLK
jgi:hypothetical protein